MRQRRCRRGIRWAGALLTAGLVSAAAALAPAGYSSTVDGRPVSMRYDPWRVSGLPVTDGPSGPRPDAPVATGTVRDGDGGDIDRLALLSVNDIADFWQRNYGGLHGRFAPVGTLISYDSSDAAGSTLCGVNTHGFVNAFYCYGHDKMAWDRGVLLPGAKRYFGDMAVTGVLAHEYGHAVQDMAKLVDSSTPVLVAEQQADCFTGAYLRWVAEGDSPRLTLSTTDGLNGLLAGLITLRDPVPGPDGELVVGAGHGTALDRIGALQLGFDTGVQRCTEIDTGDIEHRRAGTPASLRVGPTSHTPSPVTRIDEGRLSRMIEALNTRFRPVRPPALSIASACPDGAASPPVSYCPAVNTIAVDLPGLQRLTGALDDDGGNRLMLHGANTALSVVMSRYMLALQHQRGVELTSAMAGLRTACLTGLGQRRLSESSDEGTRGTLSADDLDEAVTGLLTNGLAASGADGAAVPAGFTRIQAFRSGLLGDAELCYQRYSSPA